MNQITNKGPVKNIIDTVELIHDLLKNIWFIVGATALGFILFFTYTTFLNNQNYQVKTITLIRSVKQEGIIYLRDFNLSSAPAFRTKNSGNSLYIEGVSDMISIDNSRGVESVLVNTSHVLSNHTFDMLIGSVLGMMLMIGFVYLRQMSESAIHNMSDTVAVLYLPVSREMSLLNE